MAKEQKQIKHNREERLEKGLAICEMYKNNNFTIESVCAEYGIDFTTFRNWAIELQELKDAYRAAKKGNEIMSKERIRVKAISNLEKLVNGWEYDEVIKEVIDNGGIKRQRITTKTVKVAPNPTAVIFALTNSNNTDDTNYLHKQAVTGGSDENGNDKPVVITMDLGKSI
jgi:transposase-like protein